MTNAWNESAQQLPTSLATPMEVSAKIGIPVATLAQWRWRGVGPGYLKLGRHVKYDWAVVSAWLQTQSQGGVR
ncbi:DNA-binding protein [Nakamurella antarctica]|uniref:DNA-binding protein n=1 Tax=Nakamurella antarctica TaxID=1902245 RepID=A0A3G8ZNM8_9ACTN|nr:DNA-binding protein [Nakamurella antarctica]AZI58899.1 DNA-binding protein [Nakamurella antarctica]